jgi:polyphosphate glucokinase
MGSSSAAPHTLAVDIGGSGIKAILLDHAGKPLTTRARVKTPKPATPKAVLDVIAALAKAKGEFNRVSVGFPGVVQHGIVKTAPHLDPAWKDYKLAKSLTKLLRKPVRIANDADVQGYGAIAGRGVELVLTLGTGMGSALFVDGILVPNLEMSHHPFRKGKTYDQQLNNAALKKAGSAKWNSRLAKAIKTLDHLFNYDRLYLGGGNTRHITIPLPSNVKIVPNEAGLLGGIALWRPISPEVPPKRRRTISKAPERITA